MAYMLLVVEKVGDRAPWSSHGEPVSEDRCGRRARDDAGREVDRPRECPAAEWTTIEVRELGPCFR